MASAQKNILSEDEYFPAVLDDEPGQSYQEYVQMIKEMQPIKDIADIGRIKEIPVCRK